MKDEMLFLKDECFYCDCGCNVFRKKEGCDDKYVCNSCKAQYTVRRSK